MSLGCRKRDLNAASPRTACQGLLPIELFGGTGPAVEGRGRAVEGRGEGRGEPFKATAPGAALTRKQL